MIDIPKIKRDYTFKYERRDQGYRYITTWITMFGTMGELESNYFDTLDEARQSAHDYLIGIMADEHVFVSGEKCPRCGVYAFNMYQNNYCSRCAYIVSVETVTI